MTLPQSHIALPSRGAAHLLLLGGLLALACTAITGKLALTAVIAALPIALFILMASAQSPLFSYLLYCAFMFYFHALYRYLHISGLSAATEGCLALCVLSLILNQAMGQQKNGLKWENAFSVYSVGQLFWAFFILLEMFAPYHHFDGLFAMRGIFIPIAFILISGLLLDTPQKLRSILILLGVGIITAAMKLYWQKTRGWDATEVQFLLGQEAWHTHLLWDGTVRYFSFFNDAGNFGATMGVLFTVFSIAGIALRRFWSRWFCLGCAFLAGVGLVMSGTRGAIVIPFAGLFLYILLNKNWKMVFSATLIFTLSFGFFYATDIGDGNRFIRRVRTAFRPTEDASYNVRVGNQKRFAHYLAGKPFGIGMGAHIVDTDKLMELEEDYIPTDSYLVDIWVEHGIVGLCAYLLFMGAVLARGCYLLLFRVRHPQLRQILAGMLGAVFGLLANAYAGRAMGFIPCTMLVTVFLSFVMNGPYIDRQLDPEQEL